jgi:hypothetical protein
MDSSRQLSARASVLDRHEELVARFRARRGGSIGTGGKPAVALRFDHHYDDFERKVLPALVAHQLPWAQIANRVGISAAGDGFTWSRLQELALQYGGEVWNHGTNHRDAATQAEIRDQVVGTLKQIRAHMPRLAVEGWAPPGVKAGAYMGAAPFKTVEQYTDTYAGQLILEHHAAVAGYMGERTWTLDGEMLFGAWHRNIDRHTPAEAAAFLDEAVQQRAGITIMVHPLLLDRDGYLSTEDLARVLADIAARRDAGEIEVLSYSGMWIADVGSSYRHDLAPWTDTAMVPARQSYRVEVTSGGTDRYLGATKQLVLELAATERGTVTVEISGKPTTTHALTGGLPETVRRAVTLGLDEHDITITITPDVDLTVEAFHLYAA